MAANERVQVLSLGGRELTAQQDETGGARREVVAAFVQDRSSHSAKLGGMPRNVLLVC